MPEGPWLLDMPDDFKAFVDEHHDRLLEHVFLSLGDLSLAEGITEAAFSHLLGDWHNPRGRSLLGRARRILRRAAAPLREDAPPGGGPEGEAGPAEG